MIFQHKVMNTFTYVRFLDNNQNFEDEKPGQYKEIMVTGLNNEVNNQKLLITILNRSNYE